MISRIARPLLRTQLRQSTRAIKASVRPYSSGTSGQSSDTLWALTSVGIFVPTTAYIIYSWTDKAPAAPAKKPEYEVPAAPPIETTEVTGQVSKKNLDALKAKEANFKKESKGEDVDQDALSENQKGTLARDDGSDDAKLASTRAKATDEDDGEQKKGTKELREADKATDKDDAKLDEQRTKAQSKSHPDDTHISEKTDETKSVGGKHDVLSKAERRAEGEANLAKEKKLDKESDDYIEKESWADEQVE